MRNIFKIISSVGAAALLLSGAATAAPPQAFGNWTVNTAGVITDSTTPCVGAVAGAGFEQCQVVIGGETFIRTRIAEGFGTATTLAGLVFRSEDFVKIGGTGGGLASSMTITDSTTNPGTTFGTTADILSGWAVTPAANPLLTNKTEAILGMTLNTVASSAGFDAFGSTFSVKTVTPATGPNVIETMSIGQTVGLGDLAGNKQRFELMQVGSNQALWAGQSIAGVGDFSVTQSKGAVIASVTSLADKNANAAVWAAAAVGAAPTF